MKKNYLAPEMSIARFEATDIVTVSGGETITAVQKVNWELENKRETLLDDSKTVYASMEF